MGLWASRDSQSDAALAAAEQEIATVAEHTSWGAEDVREYYAAFMAQYPSGVVDRETFIAENLEINGGTHELWSHVFSLVGRAHPLESHKMRQFKVVQSDVNDPFGDLNGRDNCAVNREKRRAAGLSESFPSKSIDDGAGDDGSVASSSMFDTRPLTQPHHQPQQRGQAAGAARRRSWRSKDSDDDDDDDDDQEMTDVRTAAQQQQQQQQQQAAAARQRSAAVEAAKLGTSYVASAIAAGGAATEGMTFSHVMIRLHRAQYSPAEKKLKYLFALLDLDGDGIVASDDLTTVLQWLYELKAVQRLDNFRKLDVEDVKNPRPRAETILTLLDRDHDRLLTQDEFLESCRMDNTLLAMLTVLRLG